MKTSVKLFGILSTLCAQILLCDAPFLDSSIKHDKKIVMINPAGHANESGRKLKDTTERSETFKMSQYLQTELEEKNEDLKVILTRVAGQEKVPFQDASLANRLSVESHVNLYVSLHCYSENSEKPKIFIYYHVADPIGDFAKRDFATKNINPVPVLLAHQFNIHKTKYLAERIQQKLITYADKELFDFGILLGMPIKYLIGIASPAISIEIGWPHGNCENIKEISQAIAACIDII